MWPARGVAGETIATAAALNPGSSFATSTAINVNDANHNILRTVTC